jgi:hypothetical protein
VELPALRGNHFPQCDYLSGVPQAAAVRCGQSNRSAGGSACPLVIEGTLRHPEGDAAGECPTKTRH